MTEAGEKTATVEKGNRFGRLLKSLDALLAEADGSGEAIDRCRERMRNGSRSCEEATRITAGAKRSTVRDGETGKRGGEKSSSAKADIEERAGEAETSEAQWYYGRGNQKMGPLAEHALLALLNRGELSVKTLVWTKGRKRWSSAEDAGLLSKQAVAAEDEPPPLPGSDDDAENKRICPKCEEANRESSKFCRGCGHSLAKVAPEPAVVEPACPSCRAVVGEDARFCRACGARLR